ncbi:MAG: hypothetical protein Sapg2KO_02300 [Saprospiraceae bacterium]
MNAESFVQYVQQLSRLYQLPYEELKSLSMQYPYFQNLHLLLALKSKLEEHPDYPRNLAKAATYSVDRAQLYRTLTKLEKLAIEDNFLLHEEVLELQEITHLEEKLKDLELIPEQATDLPLTHQLPDQLQGTASPSFNLIVPEETPPIDTIPNDVPKLVEEVIPSTLKDWIKPILSDATALCLVLDDYYKKRKASSAIAPAIAATANNSVSLPSKLSMDTLLLDSIAASSILEGFYHKSQRLISIPQAAQAPEKAVLSTPMPEIDLTQKLKQHLKKIKRKKPKPMPKKSFSTWIEQFQPAHVKPHLGDLMEAKKKEKLTLISRKSDPAKLQGDNLNFFAQKSILENKEMASETLAEILVAQMQYQKAIKVYERLSLIFPKKSAFFAGKIENLKKLIS